MRLHPDLAEFAVDHHGLVTMETAVAAGLSRTHVYRLVTDGFLMPVHAGVLRVAGAPVTWEQNLVAASLASAPAVSSHRAAARLWGLLDTRQVGNPVEVSTARPRYPRLAGVVLHRSLDLTDDHVTRRNGIPVTNPLRTMVDLGAVVPRYLVSDALERGLIKRLFTVAGVEWMRFELGRRGRSGAGVIGNVLDHRALGRDRPDGMLEPRMARVFRDYDLGSPAFQHQVHDSVGRFVARVDFAYPELMLAIEVDGYEVHGSPEAMAADFERQNQLISLGWRVLRFTWAQVVRRPASVTAPIRASLSELGTNFGGNRRNTFPEPEGAGAR